MRASAWIAAVLLLAPLAAGADDEPLGTGATDPLPSEVAAWKAFCAELERAGTEILEHHPQPHEIDRAEGPVYLAQQLSLAIRQTLAARDRSLPLLRLGLDDVYKAGFDGADAKYLGAPIEGSGTYRLHGTLGNARLIAVQAVAMGPPYRAFGSLSGDGLAPDADGRFEVMLAPRRPGGWHGPFIQTGPDATDLMVREYFGDWSQERPSAMQLERVDGGGAPPVMTQAESDRLLRAMAARFAGRTPLWLPRVDRARTALRNTLATAAPAGQGLADNFYGQGWFALAPGEALLIELDAPDARLWSFQLGNAWWESLDYVSRTGSLNGDQAVESSDGRYRIVIAGEDPGVPNWLDTAGHPEGAILFRYQQSRSAPQPSARVVPLAGLSDALPADTPTVSPAERAAEIARRRAHAATRWAP